MSNEHKCDSCGCECPGCVGNGTCLTCARIELECALYSFFGKIKEREKSSVPAWLGVAIGELGTALSKYEDEENKRDAESWSEEHQVRQGDSK